MLDTLKSLDQSLFLYLNGHHSSFFDNVMWWGTNTLTWLPLYVLLLFIVIRRYKWQAVWVLIFTAVMILFSDQLSNVVKDWVARPRPTHEPGLAGIHTLNGYLGGEFGFYSAHATNNMSIAIFLILILPNTYRYFPLLIICWAVFMAYTRIYLGVHYPGDTLAGWIAGGLIGWIFGQLCGYFVRKQ
jgi:undecaprenyl-diphosphatase